MASRKKPNKATKSLSSTELGQFWADLHLALGYYLDDERKDFIVYVAENGAVGLDDEEEVDQLVNYDGDDEVEYERLLAKACTDQREAHIFAILWRLQQIERAHQEGRVLLACEAD